nr:2-C-methyl-D-erythritol 4-phosphate cytidylyltransferase [Bacteroidota bacterium]
MGQVPHKSVVIVAGGKGKRMDTLAPKQFLLLDGIPVLIHTLQKFYQYDHNISIVLVLPQDQAAIWSDLCREYDFRVSHKVVAGGAERFHSVKHGLAHIEDDWLVAIHDGVRPLVSNHIIDKGYKIAAHSGGAVPVVPVNQTIRLVDEHSNKVVAREKYRLCQTPQTFKAKWIREAYNQHFKPEFTDDAMVYESCGYHVVLYEGSTQNIKITNPVDLEIARVILKP